MPRDSFLQNRNSYHFGMADSAINVLPHTVTSDRPSITRTTTKPLRRRFHCAAWEQQKSIRIGIERRFATSNSSNIKDRCRREFVSKPLPLPAIRFLRRNGLPPHKSWWDGDATRHKTPRYNPRLPGGRSQCLHRCCNL